MPHSERCLVLSVASQVNYETKRYQNGLAQIAMATRAVNTMQDELTAKQPVLKKAQVPFRFIILASIRARVSKHGRCRWRRRR